MLLYRLDIDRILQRHRAVSLPSTVSCICDRSIEEIAHSTLIFTAVTQNHDARRKSRHMTAKSHDDRKYAIILQR